MLYLTTYRKSGSSLLNHINSIVIFTGRVAFIKMASQIPTQGQENVECDLCQNPVSFFCRRCGVKLCDPCVTVHLRVKCKTGHDVVNYASKEEDDDACFCDSHPESRCSAYCETCDVPICILCLSIKHRSHYVSELKDKVEELLKRITRKNDQLQSYRHELKRVFDHMTHLLSSSPSYYQKKKNEVTTHGEELLKTISETVQKLNQELDGLKMEKELVLQTQKDDFENMIGQLDEINRKSMKLKESENVTEMKKFIALIESQKTMKNFTQYTFPTFHECKIDEKYIETYFGYIENTRGSKLTVPERKSTSFPTISKVSISSVIDTGFSDLLCTMAVTDDKKVWMGGKKIVKGDVFAYFASMFKRRRYILQLFDLEGNIQRTSKLPCSSRFYICMFNSRVLFSDTSSKEIQQISQDNDVVTLFQTGNWKPYGITDTASGHLLVCLRKDDQSKVVRYSDTYSVLQEIQYNSQCQPLYEAAWYITENVNGDIIVSDCKKDVIVVVDQLGIFRYVYSGTNNDLDVGPVVNDSKGLVFVADCKGNKIHILDGDGKFLQYIDSQGIKNPCALCIIPGGEIIVGESQTGISKILRYSESRSFLNRFGFFRFS